MRPGEGVGISEAQSCFVGLTELPFLSVRGSMGLQGTGCQKGPDSSL